MMKIIKNHLGQNFCMIELKLFFFCNILFLVIFKVYFFPKKYYNLLISEIFSNDYPSMHPKTLFILDCIEGIEKK